MPLSLVVRERTVWLRSSDVTVTFALGTTEPDASVTVPTMLAVTSCALRRGEIPTIKARQANTTARRWSIGLPLLCQCNRVHNPRTYVPGLTSGAITPSREGGDLPSVAVQRI